VRRSLLLAEGVSLVYVSEQPSHAIGELIASTYGRWLKTKAPGALDRPDFSLSLENGSRSGLWVRAAGTPSAGVPRIQALKMEPAIRIERTTCGLRI
jgi:hypothetical protein